MSGQLTQRILAVPVDLALIIGAAVIAFFLLAAIVVPRARRGRQGRGNGTYDRPRVGE